MSEEHELYQLRDLAAAARRTQADIDAAGLGPDDPGQAKTTNVLAIALYLIAELTEGQLSRKLGLDRLETRVRVSEFLNAAIENTGVPVERISQLETLLATATSQAARLDLERTDILDQLTAEQTKNHDLRNDIQRLLLQAEDLQHELEAARQDLAAERRHVIKFQAVAEYAWVLSGLVPLRVWDEETGSEVSASELHRLAGAALGKIEESL